MNHALIGQVAGFLAFAQVVPYTISILQGHTKPERMSYFIWLLIDVINIASYISAGARTTIWVGLVFAATGLFIFLLSLKRGLGGYSTFDFICLLLALMGVVLWIAGKDALVALYFTTFIGVVGYVPTIKKAYFLPNTENTLSWTIATTASVLNMFALTSLQPYLVLPIACSVLSQGTVTYLLLYPQSRFHHTRKHPHKIHQLLNHPILAK